MRGRNSLERNSLASRFMVWTGFVVLAAWMSSSLVYKTWYIATVIALSAVTVATLLGITRINGLSRALAPIIAYYLCLLTTALWAPYPAFVLRWVLIDSIEIPVFILFFVVGRNSVAPAIQRSMVLLTVPALLTGSYYALAQSPNLASRFGGAGLIALPVIIPFCFAEVFARGKKTLPMLSLAVAVAIVVVSRSRTPLAAALLMIGLSTFVFSRNILALLKTVAVLALSAAVLLATLLAIPNTRLLIAQTYVRVSKTDAVVGDVYLAAEGDSERETINEGFRELMPIYFPQGMGYENFIPWYSDTHGYDLALHSSYETWILEGGLACLLIIVFIITRHFLTMAAVLKRSRLQTDRNFLKACVLASVALLAVAAFHQAHQTPLFWMILGLAAGFTERFRLLRPRRRSAQVLRSMPFRHQTNNLGVSAAIRR